MSATLLSHGRVWAEFELVPTAFGKSIQLQMRRPGERTVTILEFAALGDRLIYKSMGNEQVLPHAGAEHDKRSG